MPQDNKTLAALLSGTNPSRGDRGRSARTGLGLPMPLQQANPQGPAALAQLLGQDPSQMSRQDMTNVQQGLFAMGSTGNLPRKPNLRAFTARLTKTEKRWLSEDSEIFKEVPTLRIHGDDLFVAADDIPKLDKILEDSVILAERGELGQVPPRIRNFRLMSLLTDSGDKFVP